jgi:flagellin-like hook-associated protein FlgL
MLGLTQSTQAKSTEKLSSGYKINRAADDAAGLSISEKMRKQMRGLTQASANAQDGISSVQTAEGALTEVHDMLQRMNELAVKASNGTMSENDRSYVQNEIDQLVTELDRVSETTKFNETYLLKGNAEGTKSDMKVNAHDAGLAGSLVDNGDTATFTVKGDLKDGEKVTIAGKEYTIGGTDTNDISTYKKLADFTALTNVAAGDSLTDASTGITYTVVDKVAADTSSIVDDVQFTVTHEDGTKTDFTVGSGDGKIGKTQALQYIKDELAAGSSVKMTNDGTSAVDLDIVESLVTTGTNQEVSSAALTATTVAGLAAKTPGGAVTVAAGDTAVIGGTTYTATANAPRSASDVAKVVSALGEGDMVQITRGTDTIEFTVGNETDAIKKTYSTADILANIKDGDQIAFAISAQHITGTGAASAAQVTPTTTITKDGLTAATHYTVVGDTASTKDGVITKAKALELIGDELQKASSIGTDTAASVKNNNDGSFTITKGTVEVVDKLDFNLHVGADADMTNKINVNIDAMSAAGLGVKGLNVKDTTGISATYAIDAIEDAIQKVSTQRSALGAVQNRLEHTIANLDNVVENTTAAESQIRDTDMATEMVKYSNNNILAQAGQAMLAQANQSNQGVLSLLG